MSITTDHLTRRERKKLATTETIARVALKFAVDRGLSETTVEMITDAADVSYRTFFNYFSSKEEAALWLGPSLEEELSQFIIDRPVEPLLDTVAALVHEHLNYFEEYRDVLKMRGRAAARCGSLRVAMQAQIHRLDSAMGNAFAHRLGVSAGAIEPFFASRSAASLLELAARSVVEGKSLDEVHMLIDDSVRFLRAGLIS